MALWYIKQEKRCKITRNRTKNNASQTYRAIHDATSEVMLMTRVIRVTYFGVIAYHYHNASVCVSELGGRQDHAGFGLF